jgi:tetratricopeptide (TPR) repeat protein
MQAGSRKATLVSTVLDRVKALKESAKFGRDFDDYQSAIDDLKEALKLLHDEYDEWRAQRQPEAEESDDEEYANKLLSHLADCYGMLGGIYRRQGLQATSEAERRSNLEMSKQMYATGLEYEREDSYNLVNTIIVPILIDPNAYAGQGEAIKNALQKVAAQVRDKRKDLWWAWADLGLLCLLDGNLDEAINAYAQLKRTGAGPEQYDSTIAVLEDLKKSCEVSSLPVVGKLEQAIDYLTKNKP